MQEANTKQQIVDKIKKSTNILVTVGANPSVDELSAALALSLMLNRLDKHSTAVFSGATPPAISFLEPEKTFENSVDSLRDFIIALDKEKADRLRYKVEDDVVRIFITPYKTVLSEKDLQFSQGDFNVELIVALGVEKRDDLDAAITAHGRILHDATVVTVNTKSTDSTLGSIDWTQPDASSLCEMLTSLSDALKTDLLDQQIATALLTGIVSATDRFRNERTSPKVMTMSAQLMAAGANQQLIAEKLAGAEPVAVSVANDEHEELPEGDVSKKVTPDEETEVAPKDDGSLEIVHEPKPAEPTPMPEPGEDALKAAEEELAKNLEAKAQQQPAPDLAQELEAESAQQPDVATEESVSSPEAEQQSPSSDPEPQDQTDDPPVPEQVSSPQPQIVKEHRTWKTDDTASTPSFGGTLNATTTDAEEEKRREDSSAYNHQLLSHDAPAATETNNPSDVPMTAAPAEPGVPAPAPSFPFTAAPDQGPPDQPLPYEPAPPAGPSGPTLADIDSQTRGKAAEEARAAVDAVLSSMPFDPAHQPLESAGAVPAIHVDHEGTIMPASQVSPPVESSSASPSLAGLPTPPPLPPLPDFSTLPPLPGADQAIPSVPAMEPTPVSPVATPVAAAPADPGQFRIPGQ